MGSSDADVRPLTVGDYAGVGAATLTVVRSLEEVGQGDLTHDIKVDNWSKETRLASQLLNDA